MKPPFLVLLCLFRGHYYYILELCLRLLAYWNLFFSVLYSFTSLCDHTHLRFCIACFLLGKGWTCVDTLRPLAVSTLADFVHSVRSDLSFAQLSRAVHLFLRNMKARYIMRIYIYIYICKYIFLCLCKVVVVYQCMFV